MKSNLQELDKISTNFTQFIVAVNGALIAYAIKQVETSNLEYKFIPLGLALLFWGLSFFYGISSVRKLLSSRVMSEFKDTIAKKNTEVSQLAGKEALDSVNKANDHNKSMYKFLYLGGISYIVWQLIEMIIRTYC